MFRRTVFRPGTSFKLFSPLACTLEPGLVAWQCGQPVVSIFKRPAVSAKASAGSFAAFCNVQMATAIRTPQQKERSPLPPHA